MDNCSHHNIIALETVKESDSFIEKYFTTYYPKTHNVTYRNKGANLGLALKAISKVLADEYIMQITGRYHFMDTYFLKAMENNPGYDFYGKDTGYDNYFTGAFGMRTTYFVDWINTTDWDQLNLQMINFENSLKKYCQSNNLKKYMFDSLHMDCNIFGHGTPERVFI